MHFHNYHHSSLAKYATINLKGYFPVRIHKRFQCSYPKTPGINIDLQGILKLLSNLIPDKALGQDGINL